MREYILDPCKWPATVGIEYEGATLDEYAGIRATKALLEKVRAELVG